MKKIERSGQKWSFYLTGPSTRSWGLLVVLHPCPCWRREFDCVRRWLDWNGMRSITKFCQSCRRNGIERSRRRLECRSSCLCPSPVLLPCRVPTTTVEGNTRLKQKLDGNSTKKKKREILGKNWDIRNEREAGRVAWTGRQAHRRFCWG